MLDIQPIECPNCGEIIHLAVDASAGPQRYIEDCHVCCQPITVLLEIDEDDTAYVRVQSQDAV